ncbi:MAG: hypothetical protein KF858_00010 [Candidatus Sumerlaeia bacterium]|nr:hypothetical protein [Candidatus Sumerlaeia bacterium]
MIRAAFCLLSLIAILAVVGPLAAAGDEDEKAPPPWTGCNPAPKLAADFPPTPQCIPFVLGDLPSQTMHPDLNLLHQGCGLTAFSVSPNNGVITTPGAHILTIEMKYTPPGKPDLSESITDTITVHTEWYHRPGDHTATPAVSANLFVLKPSNPHTWEDWETVAPAHDPFGSYVSHGFKYESEEDRCLANVSANFGINRQYSGYVKASKFFLYWGRADTGMHLRTSVGTFGMMATVEHGVSTNDDAEKLKIKIGADLLSSFAEVPLSTTLGSTIPFSSGLLDTAPINLPESPHAATHPLERKVHVVIDAGVTTKQVGRAHGEALLELTVGAVPPDAGGTTPVLSWTPYVAP